MDTLTIEWLSWMLVSSSQRWPDQASVAMGPPDSPLSRRFQPCPQGDSPNSGFPPIVELSVLRRLRLIVQSGTGQRPHRRLRERHWVTDGEERHLDFRCEVSKSRPSQCWDQVQQSAATLTWCNSVSRWQKVRSNWERSFEMTQGRAEIANAFGEAVALVVQHHKVVPLARSRPRCCHSPPRLRQTSWTRAHGPLRRPRLEARAMAHFVWIYSGVTLEIWIPSRIWRSWQISIDIQWRILRNSDFMPLWQLFCNLSMVLVIKASVGCPEAPVFELLTSAHTAGVGDVVVLCRNFATTVSILVIADVKFAPSVGFAAVAPGATVVLIGTLLVNLSLVLRLVATPETSLRSAPIVPTLAFFGAIFARIGRGRPKDGHGL